MYVLTYIVRNFVQQLVYPGQCDPGQYLLAYIFGTYSQIVCDLASRCVVQSCLPHMSMLALRGLVCNAATDVSMHMRKRQMMPVAVICCRQRRLTSRLLRHNMCTYHAIVSHRRQYLDIIFVFCEDLCRIAAVKTRKHIYLYIYIFVYLALLKYRPFNPWLLKTRMSKQKVDILFAFQPSSHTELSNEINSLSLWLFVSLSLCLYVSLSLCLSVPPSLCLFVSMSLCLSVSIPLSQSISLFLSLSVSLHAYVYLYILTCIHVLIYTRICIIYTPVNMYIYIYISTYIQYTYLNVVGWEERKREVRNLLHLMYHLLYVCMYLLISVCSQVYGGGRGCLTAHRWSGNQQACASMTPVSDSLCITPPLRLWIPLPSHVIVMRLQQTDTWFGVSPWGHVLHI